MYPRLVAALAVLTAACAAPRPEARGTTIVNVRVVDGTGAPSRTGAVRFVGDTIVAVGDVTPAPDDDVVDGKGMVVAPGFIDTHSHHNEGLANARAATAAVSQGITTIIAGVDGAHPMPLARSLDSLTTAPAAVNVAYYAGHGTLRVAVMGDDYKRKATDAEVDSMARLLERELGAGALGLSTGLEYDPGIYSDPSEVVRLAKVSAAAGGRYISHLRSEDRDFWAALDEIIAIGREARLPVQISHLKLAMIPLWGQADSVLRVLDRARAAGVDITADVYPYAYWQSTLTVLYPDRNFEDRRETERILRDVVPAEGLRLGTFAPDTHYAGKTVAEIAQLRREDAAATLMYLIRASQDMASSETERAENGVVSGGIESVIATAMHEQDIERLLAWKHTNVCSDGLLDGPHPRGFGAFPRVFARYARERGVLSEEEAIRKMTSLAAAHVGVARRGTLAPGNYADLVLFDSAALGDRATPAEPHLPSSGVLQVWVNGRVVWRDGRPSGAFPGRVLRRAASAR